MQYIPRPRIHFKKRNSCMRLASFQITNFRSINDSGPIDSPQITAILGRNDSGKSNLLRALHSLNPAEGLV
jgi:recombinational DNA repair ATPase RecF